MADGGVRCDVLHALACGVMRDTHGGFCPLWTRCGWVGDKSHGRCGLYPPNGAIGDGHGICRRRHGQCT